MYDEHDFDDCECPAGVVSRVEGTVRSGFFLLIAGAAFGIYKIALMIKDAFQYVLNATDWPMVGGIALASLVGFCLLFALVLFSHAFWHDWKHEQKKPRALTFVTNIAKELYGIGLQIAAKKEYKRLIEIRPEIVEKSWEELVLEQSHHPVLDQVTDPEILLALMSTFEATVREYETETI